MSKKIIALIAALAIITALSGCGGKKADAPAETSFSSASVSYLGPEGTYTQEACGVFFGNEGEYIPYETVNDAVDALTAGESDYAVIPQENTIGGVVTDYLDILISSPEVSVAGEVELTINQNLLALPGTSLEDIKTVYSHKQGISQGSEWLGENLPDAEIVETSSTAEGAKTVSQEQNPSCAAIASAACADVYGLEILAAGIQKNDANKTRFYVLTAEKGAAGPADRTAFIASGSARELPKLMAEMEKQGMTLETVHDCPLKTELGSYYYLIEYSGGGYEEYLGLTEKCALEFRYLGSFDKR